MNLLIDENLSPRKVVEVTGVGRFKVRDLPPP